MTHTTVLSVRGDAATTVAPDAAVLTGEIRTSATTKADALGSASAALDAVVAALAGLGGRVLPADGERVPLGWAAASVTSYPETTWDDRKREQPTGQVIAFVGLMIRVRDLHLLDRIAATLADHDTMHLHRTEWAVDADNAAWGRVRAAAIQAAVQKGRDYAVALGGVLTSIDEIADAGLLDGAVLQSRRDVVALSGGMHHESGPAPSLDPVPQTLTAVIDARLSASIADLGSGPDGAKRVTP